MTVAPDARALVLWSRGRVSLSTNRGETFSAVFEPPLGNSVGNVTIPKAAPNRILVWSNEGAVFLSRDGGRSFSRGALPGVADQRGLDEQPLFAEGDANRIWIRVWSREFGVTRARLFRSVDGGASWTSVDVDGLAGPGQTSPPVFDACSPSTLYAITSDQESILRSRDAGVTWSRLTPSFEGGQTPVFRQLASAKQGCRLVALTTDGVIASQDQGLSWRPSRRGMRMGFFDLVAYDLSQPERVFAANWGLFRSDDGGSNFRRLDNALTGRLVTHLFVHPDGTVLVEAFIDGRTRFLHSGDGGESFTEATLSPPLDGWIGRGAAAVNPSNPSHVVAYIDGRNLFAAVIGMESFDFGRTWSQLPIFSTGSPFPANSVAFDPSDPSRLWGAGRFQSFLSEDGGASWTETGAPLEWLKLQPETGHLWGGSFGNLYRSTDRGASWALVQEVSAEADLRDIAFDPRAPETLLVATDRSRDASPLLRSTDGGQSWSSWNAAGPSLTSAARIERNPADPGRVIVAGANGIHWFSEAPQPECPSYRDPALCVQNGRFEVSIEWEDFEGRQGQGQVVPLQTNASGLLTFFDPDNWEVMVKVLDACSFEGYYWVFSAATTTVDYALHVTDRATGRFRTYANFLGENAPAVTDTRAFPCDSGPGASWNSESASLEHDAPALSLPSLPSANCGTPDNPALCLGEDGRFRLSVRWRDFAGNTGPGLPVDGSSRDSGLFTFFGPSNWEMMVKVLDGCAVDSRYWIFGAATTNVQFDLEITDQLTGTRRVYSNPLGLSAPAIIDTSSFEGCP
ncbi:MAG: hypothetical protein AAF725_11480 [Acidobacteriota bacterium]